MTTHTTISGNAEFVAATGRRKKIAMSVFLALAAIVALLFAVVALQPSDFRVERMATIPAPPSRVFPLVNNLHRWQAWSPWERIDPNLQRTYTGPESGVGASYRWVGNSDVGEGRMTIIESTPDELVRIKLEFFKPFAAVSTAEFSFEPVANSQTKVTWSMSGPKNLLAKAIHLFISMDKMIGGQFEQGLANLTAAVEAESKQ
jgi:hypothetical protein